MIITMPTIKLKKMTAKIYSFIEYSQKRDNALRLSLGYSEEMWDMMKDNGYNTNDPEDIDQFFWDLGEEEDA